MKTESVVGRIENNMNNCNLTVECHTSDKFKPTNEWRAYVRKQVRGFITTSELFIVQFVDGSEWSCSKYVMGDYWERVPEYRPYKECEVKLGEVFNKGAIYYVVWRIDYDGVHTTSKDGLYGFFTFADLLRLFTKTNGAKAGVLVK